MRFAFIGSVQFSRSILEHLIASGHKPALTITRANAGINADHADLTPLCGQFGIPALATDDINAPGITSTLAGLQPDLIICCGWSQIIRKKILDIPRMGVIGYHPAALPKNRGRHPIIWALALGLEETASTFFLMDEGTDSGDILSQEAVDIEYQDDAAALYRKITETAKRQITDIMTGIATGEPPALPQDHCAANYWRKRTRADGQIDFRMSSRLVYNLVRALGKPYAGAHLMYRGMEVKIWKVREESIPGIEHIEPGKVLEAANGALLVKCMDACIWLLEHEFESPPGSETT